MLIEQLDWEKMDGMMLVIVQYVVFGEVLMFGYMNKEVLEKIEVIGKVIFYLCIKQWLWIKGEILGYVFNVVSIMLDCDNDMLLVLVNLIGLICYKGIISCFGEIGYQWLFFYQLEQLLVECKYVDLESFYMVKLYVSGIKCIVQKVGEEGVEIVLVVIVNDCFELKNEVLDLMYYLLVLLQDQGLDFGEVIDNLRVWYR